MRLGPRSTGKVAWGAGLHRGDDGPPARVAAPQRAGERRRVDYLPIFLDIRDRPALVVGGGAVAARKADLLLRAGARPMVVAPEAGDAIAALARRGRVALAPRRFAADDLAGVAVAVAATDDRATNEAVSAAARAAGVPVNVVDQPALSTFILPAVIDRSPVVLAISSGGRAPVLARLLRAQVESLLPHGYGRLARLAGEFRALARARIEDPVGRRRFWERVFESAVAEDALAGRDAAAAARLTAMLDGPAQAGARQGAVYMVGAGPGDPDLLTFRALRLMQRADIVLHDRLIPEAILDLVRREADRINVGKCGGRHAMPQAEIGRLMVKLAREGRRVLRLKGGDPFIFAHGGEETAALLAQDIPFQVVPGITAASGCATAAGIPLTHRDHADACVFVTGHRAEDRTDLDWAMLARPRQTVVVYMGLGSAATIARELIAHGAAPSRPAAIIVDGTLASQRVIAAPLSGLAAAAADARDLGGAALIIIGDVARLARG